MMMESFFQLKDKRKRSARSCILVLNRLKCVVPFLNLTVFHKKKISDKSHKSVDEVGKSTEAPIICWEQVGLFWTGKTYFLTELIWSKFFWKQN